MNLQRRHAEWVTHKARIHAAKRRCRRPQGFSCCIGPRVLRQMTLPVDEDLVGNDFLYLIRPHKLLGCVACLEQHLACLDVSERAGPRLRSLAQLGAGDIISGSLHMCLFWQREGCRQKVSSGTLQFSRAACACAAEALTLSNWNRSAPDATSLLMSSTLFSLAASTRGQFDFPCEMSLMYPPCSE